MRRATLSNPPNFALSEQGNGIIGLTSDTDARAYIFVLEEDIVRLLLLTEGVVKGPPSWAIAPGATDLEEPGRDRLSTAGFSCVEYTIVEDGGILTIETKQIRLSIRLAGFHCRWEQHTDAGWSLMMEDRPTQAYNFGWWDERVQHHVAKQPGDRYYGLGDRSGDLDRNGRRFRLSNVDAMGYDAQRSDPLYKSIPYMLVADAAHACHGLFYDLMGEIEVDLGLEIDNYHGPFRSLYSRGGDLDIYMIAGPDPMEVTRRFTWMTGRPAMMPRWSVGYSGSTMTYTDAPDAQVRMFDFIDKLEEHDIGCTSFHLSSGYTSIGPKRYVFHWNRDKFPDPEKFVSDYRTAGIELVPNIKPALLRDHPQYAAAAEAGALVSDQDGNPTEVQFWDEVGSYIDFTNPKGAEWWKAQLKSSLLDFGMRSTWNDNNEYTIWDRRAQFNFFGQPRPAYEGCAVQPLLMSRASRSAQIAHDDAHRPYVVTRSGMAGLHRYAQTWTGDNRTDWQTIRYNAKMGVSMALSGVSNCGHDVGGFSGRKPEAALFLRWVQAGILMPRFSIHSWNDDASVNEPWMYPEAVPAVRRLMAIRQTLAPAIYDLLWRYHLHYEPVSRPLWLDFPTDRASWTDGDSHMLGSNLLVSLVCEPDVETVPIALPGHGDWLDIWTGERHAGGTSPELAIPLDGAPSVLAREGSAMPVDLARGGYRPEPFERGLWLFPARGDGAFEWSFHEDDGKLDGAHQLWRGECRSTGGTVSISVHRDGPALYGNGTITMLLPPGDTRPLTIDGHEADPVTIAGRNGIRVSID